MRKLGCLMCAFFLLIPLQGCKFKDLDLKLFIVAMGIDVSENDPDKLNVTVKIAVPLGDPKDAEERTIFLTEEATTISEAVRRMKSRTDKELDFGHCKALIFGEDYARKDVRQTIDWMLRRRDIQLLLLTAVGKPTAKEVLAIQPKTERLPGNALFLALSLDGTESPFIVPAAYSFILDRNKEEIGSDPILPVVEAKGKEEFDVDKAYLFDKTKAVMMLEPEETRIYNMLRDLNVKTSMDVKFKGVNYAYNFYRFSSKYKLTTTKEGSPCLNYKLNIHGSIEENSQGTTISQSELKEISLAAQERMNSQVEKVLQKIHKSGTDPLGWGLRYRARHWNSVAEEEKAWDDLYPQLTFKVSSKVEIKYTGMIR